ncbi:MAG: N-acetylmuramoyl-L-alanine amidase [Bacteroidia bacterium]|nr:N-acetylmuramoyl-L-alanine amidase [Bacteroidia bacterium]MDW8235301.1 N-acetylmuramoyl-L-alanine amidase [Bacteroidia bacterium]
MRYWSIALFFALVWAQAPRLPENPYAAFFDSAYQRHPLVPRGALEAIAYTQSRFSVLTPSEPSCTGIPQGIGLFGWIEDGKDYFRENLKTISILSGYSIEQLKASPQVQVEALAAAYEYLMRQRGIAPKQYGAHRDIFIALGYLPLSPDPVNDFAQQSELFEIYRFLADPEAAQKYGFSRWEVDLKELFRENYRVLSASQVIITPDEIRTEEGYTYRTQSTDYSGAIWNPAASCNYNSRPAGASITHVTVHTIQGSYAGCISWFKNCSAGVSAHYVLRSSDGQITQMVREADRAWHVGVGNNYSIGLEHEGYVSNPSWYTQAMYQASAALVRDIAQRRGINPRSTWFGNACTGTTEQCYVKTCVNIKGHQQYPSQTHSDPGPHWNWDLYYRLINGPQYMVNQTLTTPSGTIYDPGGASANYADLQRYFIKIAPPGANSITLTFEQFDLENNFSVAYPSAKGGDYLYIYEGDSVVDPLLRRLTGNSLPSTLTVNGGSVLLELRTDCSTNGPGWRISYTSTGSNTSATDNIPPTTQIQPLPEWVTGDFSVQFQDADNGGRQVEKAFYLVMYDTAGDWRANAQRGFFSDNFQGPALHPDWTSVVGNWSIQDPGNGDPVLRQSNESSPTGDNTNLYAYLKQDLSNRYLYHWAGRFTGGSSTNRRMGLHIFADNPTATNRGNSYFVFFRMDHQKAQLYKVVGNSWGSGPVVDVPYTFQLNTWYDFKWSYDRITGDHRVYINNQLVISWKDPNPIGSGSYISLRTGNAIAEYNNFKVYRSRPNNGTVMVQVGPTGDIRFQSRGPAHEAGLIRSIVQDTAGNLSTLAGRWVKVDWTPPTAPPEVFDGNDPPNDVDIITQNTLLEAAWTMAQDTNSGIHQYEYALGTSPGAADVISWTPTSNTSRLSVSLASGTISAGTTYYVGIRAVNGVNMRGEATFSDGFIYDVSASLNGTKVEALLLPNPSQGPARLGIFSVGREGLPYAVEILATTGAQVWKGEGQVGRFLALPELAEGIYVVRVQGEDFTQMLRWIVR